MTIKRFIRCNENHYDGDTVAITSRDAKKPRVLKTFLVVLLGF